MSSEEEDDEVEVVSCYALDRFARDTFEIALKVILEHRAEIAHPITRLVLVQDDYFNIVSWVRIECGDERVGWELDWPDTKLPANTQDDDQTLAAFAEAHEVEVEWNSPFELPRAAVFYELLLVAESLVEELRREKFPMVENPKVMVGNRNDPYGSSRDMLEAMHDSTQASLSGDALSAFAALLYEDEARQKWFVDLPSSPLPEGAGGLYALFKITHKA